MWRGDLVVSIGESESPSVIDEEEVGVGGHEIGSKKEASLATILAGLNLEKVATVEGLRRELQE